MRTCLNIFLLLIIAWPALVPAESLTLVEEGTPACEIVVGKDDNYVKVYGREASDRTWREPAALVSHAAADLERFLREIARLGNVRIPVLSHAGPSNAKARILLGSAAVKQYGLEAEAAALSYSGYIYRVKGNDLLIFGSSNKGTANGVYGFLQDELGVRWFGAPELFWKIPRSRTIQIGAALDKRVEPSFHGRFGGPASAEDPSAYWAMRLMRMQEKFDSGEPYVNASHDFIRKLFNAQTYAKDHPGWYGMRDGRRLSASPTRHNFNLCWSNPEVVEKAVEGALEFFRADPRNQSFSVGVNDAPAYCECEKCTALQPERHYGDGRSTVRGGKVASDMYYHFVNEVARRVGKKFPDRSLGVIAYRDVSAPPLGPIEPNVHVVLVCDPSEYYDREYRKTEEALVRDWKKKGVRLGLYYYTGLAKLVPAYWPRFLGEQLKERHADGFVCLFTEESSMWPMRGPMKYVESRLWWDANLDVDDLLNEYFEKLFGPAAPEMGSFYDRLEEIHLRPRVGGFFFEHYALRQFRPYHRNDLNELRSLLAKAHEKINGVSVGGNRTGDKAGRRVAYVSRGFHIFFDMLEGLVLSKELDDWRHNSRMPFNEMEAIAGLEKVERISDLVSRHEATYRETITLDPAMSERFTVDTIASVRDQWKQRLEKEAASTLTFLAGNSLSDSFNDRLRQTASNICKNEKINLFYRIGTKDLTFGPNLAENPGFSETIAESSEGGSLRAAKWEGISQRPGVRVDTVEISENGTRNRVGRISAPGTRAYCFLPIKGFIPGRTYLFEADAMLRGESGGSSASVNMTIRWRGPKGWINAVPDDLDTGNAENTWAKLSVVAVAPPQADSARLFFNVFGQGEGEEALFDNVSARELKNAANPVPSGKN